MDYTVTIKFKKKNKVASESINGVIALLPVTYKSGHTQANMMGAMYPTKNYEISFRGNQEAAERFRLNLFEKYGNIFDIKCNFM